MGGSEGEAEGCRIGRRRAPVPARSFPACCEPVSSCPHEWYTICCAEDATAPLPRAAHDLASTNIGSTITLQSWTTAYLSMLARPVWRSTSTSDEDGRLPRSVQA